MVLFENVSAIAATWLNCTPHASREQVEAAGALEAAPVGLSISYTLHAWLSNPEGLVAGHSRNVERVSQSHDRKLFASSNKP